MKKNCLILLILLLYNNKVFSLSLESFKIQKINVDGRELRVAVADNLAKRAQGLSNTEEIDLKRRFIDGMLFIFEDESEKTFQSWYMRYDLMLIILHKKGKNDYTVAERIPLRIGTTVKIRGKYVLEIPLSRK